MKKFEIYDKDRYFTVTGNHIEGTPLTIACRQDELNAVYHEVFGNDKGISYTNSRTNVLLDERKPVLDDDEIIIRAFESKDGKKFKRLFKGNISDYPSHSEADLALCCKLAFWSNGNPSQIDRLFRKSGLCRPKWDEMHGEKTYGEITIERALSIVEDFYTPPADDEANSPTKLATTVKPLPEIPIELITSTIYTTDELLTIFRRYFYVEEDYAITGPVCALLGNFLPYEVDIFGIIGPSGSLKTEVLRSFGETENQFVYTISSITENTLVSGYEKNQDLIPLLRHRAVVIKDFTSILSRKEDVRSAIFAQLREVTDGYVRCEYGSGVKREYRDIHSSIIFASTNAIERYYSMYSNLGSRLMFMRPKSDPDAASVQAEKNQPYLKEIRQELHNGMMSFIDFHVNRLQREPHAFRELPEEMKDRLRKYSGLLAKVRTTAHHDYRGHIDEIPTPEFPTRIFNTITKMARLHAFIYDREANDIDLSFAMRIILDNIPTMRLEVLRHMDTELITTNKLSQSTGLSVYVLSRVLDELTALGICTKLARDNVDALENENLSKQSNHYQIATQELYDIICQLDSCNSLTCKHKNKNELINYCEEENENVRHENNICRSLNHTCLVSSELIRNIANELRTRLQKLVDFDVKRPPELVNVPLIEVLKEKFPTVDAVVLEETYHKLIQKPPILDLYLTITGVYVP